MEALDHDRMMLALYPVLLDRVEHQALDARGLHAVIATAAQGYSFPTNLDSDPPLKGLAPQTGQQLLHQALAAGGVCARGGADAAAATGVNQRGGA